MKTRILFVLGFVSLVLTLGFFVTGFMTGCGGSKDSGIDGAACGDGIVADTEVCDDGELLNGTIGYCDVSCLFVPDVILLTETSCTDLTDNDGDGYLDCADDDCVADPACVVVVVEAVCGNGIIEGSETCDDANVVDGDGCSAACVIEVAIVDTDGDGTADASDAEVDAASCLDELDNDGDGTVDCLDLDCAAYMATDLDCDGQLNDFDADKDADGIDSTIDPDDTVVTKWWYVWPILDNNCNRDDGGIYTPTKVAGSSYTFVHVTSTTARDGTITYDNFSLGGSPDVPGVVDDSKNSGMYNDCFADDFYFSGNFALAPQGTVETPNDKTDCVYYSSSAQYAGEWDGICIESAAEIIPTSRSYSGTGPALPRPAPMRPDTVRPALQELDFPDYHF